MLVATRCTVFLFSALVAENFSLYIKKAILTAFKIGNIESEGEGAFFCGSHPQLDLNRLTTPFSFERN